MALSLLFTMSPAIAKLRALLKPPELSSSALSRQYWLWGLINYDLINFLRNKNRKVIKSDFSSLKVGNLKKTEIEKINIYSLVSDAKGKSGR